MKYILSVCLSLIANVALAGTLTIIPDNTSTMGIQKQQRDAEVRSQAERRARVAAGVEQAPPVIIIRQAPQPRRNTHMDCYSYGPNKQYLSCD